MVFNYRAGVDPTTPPLRTGIGTGLLGLAIGAALFWGLLRFYDDHLGVLTDDQLLANVDVDTQVVTPLASVVLLAVIMAQVATVLNSGLVVSTPELVALILTLTIVLGIFYVTRSENLKKGKMVLEETLMGATLALLAFWLTPPTDSVAPGLLALLALTLTVADPALGNTKTVHAMAAASLFFLVLSPSTRAVAPLLYAFVYASMRYVK
mmetsp:Transcript_9076/g.16751  ORF Transcript_9076/g.16751 Transcript_9076/m.16751 type:complete len:209 (-) Transcript_9076:562-1188(-)|eukprot:CAMPEP_0184510350 /NCGR_PEP_ID=MMETSP0198_2-20121128/1765_1 /TAXON_ID=1112570 /ORGANISM="Thraustochytrium sp., Strain LLF1b" /LENGTH=208 /DNA_ID=CAMNT_0026900231 /DNA_START=113 /DNA_END=739 /DNA_ORIENTATION=+